MYDISIPPFILMHSYDLKRGEKRLKSAINPHLCDVCQYEFQHILSSQGAASDTQ